VKKGRRKRLEETKKRRRMGRRGEGKEYGRGEARRRFFLHIFLHWEMDSFFLPLMESARGLSYTVLSFS
jgi:hypothetical protein